MAGRLEHCYPNITYFVQALGWIEVGYNVESPLTSFIRAIDQGGMVWEGDDLYSTLDAAFNDLEAELGVWMREEGIEPAKD